jgi:hypothetical protein
LGPGAGFRVKHFFAREQSRIAVLHSILTSLSTDQFDLVISLEAQQGVVRACLPDLPSGGVFIPPAVSLKEVDDARHFEPRRLQKCPKGCVGHIGGVQERTDEGIFLSDGFKSVPMARLSVPKS